MIDFQGHTWTANAGRTLVTCDDGRKMVIDPAMTDAYVMSVVQKLSDDANTVATQRADQQVTAQYARNDPVVQFLATHTPDEIIAYVNTNVTDLASAKTLLGKIGVAMSVFVKQQLR